MKSRRAIIAARRFALLATLALRGQPRALAWAVHEVLRIGPTVLRNSALLGPMARRFSANGRQVWLTVDDGPHPDSTPAVLDVLDAHGAQASFFVIGRAVDRYRDLAREITLRGHRLENHTYSHPAALFWSMPECLIEQEMQRCSHSIRVAAGTSPQWFRPPAGLVSNSLHPAAAREWLRVCGWSADGLDGLPGRDPEHAVERILRRVSPGAILLVHEGAGRRGPETMDRLLQRLSDGGYTCVIPAQRDVIS